MLLAWTYQNGNVSCIATIYYYFVSWIQELYKYCGSQKMKQTHAGSQQSQQWNNVCGTHTQYTSLI